VTKPERERRSRQGQIDDRARFDSPLKSRWSSRCSGVRSKFSSAGGDITGLGINVVATGAARGQILRVAYRAGAAVGDLMPIKLTKIWFATMVVLASSPALAADMPGSGTKNFIPGGDAPSYFTNENGAVSGVAAVDEASSDDGVDQTLGSPRSETAPMHSAKTMTRRHGGLAASHRREENYSTSKFTARGRSAHVASANKNRVASVGAPFRSPRTTGRITNPPKAKSDGAGIARPAKSSTRHAAAKSAARKG
jgi:hypothetical protein